MTGWRKQRGEKVLNGKVSVTETSTLPRDNEDGRRPLLSRRGQRSEAPTCASYLSVATGGVRAGVASAVPLADWTLGILLGAQLGLRSGLDHRQQ